MVSPDYKKIVQALNYLAAKDGGKTNYMKALKLLYLADRLHLRKYGRLITDDRLVAMKNGTLGSQARDIVLQSEHLPHVVHQYVQDKLIRDIGNYSIEVNDKEKDRLSKTDLTCLDEVFSVLGEKDRFDLAELTHHLPEYKRQEFAIKEEEKRVSELVTSDLFRSSDDVDLGELYSQSADELNSAQELFLESQEHRSHIG